MDSTFVRVRGEDHVAVVELDRPRRHNAIGPRLARELEDVARTVNDDPDVRAVVLAGAGRSFCAGADMKERLAGPKESEAVFEAVRRASRAIHDFELPVVAAVHGHALGAGLELAATCDYRVADRSAVLGLPEVKQGITSGGGLLALASLIPRGALGKLAFGGRIVDAPTALSLGLVDEIVDEGEALPSALALAQEFAEHPRRVLVACKEVIRAVAQPLAPQQWTFVGHLQRALEGGPDQQTALERHQSAPD